MEELTKQQIVLVTLLVSFVTSIATGIVTVALMDQAPPGVTQTINRVVERTIEKVTPAPTQQQASVITKETVVVKEDDLVVSAVEKNAKSLVSILKVSGEGDTKTEVFVGNGLVVSKDGLIATDAAVAAAILDENQNPTTATLKAVFSDGVAAPLSAVASTNKDGLVFFKPAFDDKTKKTVFIPALISDSAALKLGQAVIALGGEKVSVATGIVSNLSGRAGGSASPDAAASTTSPAVLPAQIIRTDIHTIKSSGAILVNLSGDVVGIRAAETLGADNEFLSARVIKSALLKIPPASLSNPAAR